LSALPHCNVTIVPYHLARAGAVPQLTKPIRTPPAEATADDVAKDRSKKGRSAKGSKPGRAGKATKATPKPVSFGDLPLPPDRVAIADVAFRQRAKIVGKVYSMRVHPWSGVASLELSIVDDTGALTIVFFGRRHLAG